MQALAGKLQMFIERVSQVRVKIPRGDAPGGRATHLGDAIHFRHEWNTFRILGVIQGNPRRDHF
jgi:hypothetical protein